MSVIVIPFTSRSKEYSSWFKTKSEPSEELLFPFDEEDDFAEELLLFTVEEEDDFAEEELFAEDEDFAEEEDFASLEEEIFVELLETLLEDSIFDELDSALELLDVTELLEATELLDAEELLDVILEEDSSNVWLCPMDPYLE